MHNLELEYKFDAGGVDVVKFCKVMRDLAPDGHDEPDVRDHYYVSGCWCSPDPVRLRDVGDGFRELTSKKRRSEESLRERVEVNVAVAERTKTEDVGSFMRMIGYHLAFTLAKPQCHVFHFIEPGVAEVEVAFYTVAREHAEELVDHRAFIEVEVKEASGPKTAVDHLNKWKSFLQEVFHLDEPMNQSLFEIYNR